MLAFGGIPFGPLQVGWSGLPFKVFCPGGIPWQSYFQVVPQGDSLGPNLPVALSDVLWKSTGTEAAQDYMLGASC